MADNILILGGDGFCGWPTALHLSNKGYNVTIVDNFSRRVIDTELGTNSVIPIDTLDQRVKTWRSITRKLLRYKVVDIATNYLGVCDLLKKTQPSAIVHFAEQRAAPYSMKSSKHKMYTVHNNVKATHNLLCALLDTGTDAHIIHLGTTGVYGYGTAGITIPEGYIECKLKDAAKNKWVDTEIYYPPSPGSVYHMTKVIDTNLFAYYNKNDGIRVTDLHQGIVWGASTEETMMHQDLANRFDYDGDYGTVLNRFITQSVIGHPLTVYGSGGQTRAFIHIQNTVQCIELAIQNPPNAGERVKVWNQTTEQLNLMDIAKMVREVTGAEIRLYDNPRVEADSNTLALCSNNIHALGLDPIHVTKERLLSLYEYAAKYKERIIKEKIYCTSVWRKEISVDRQGADEHGC